MARTHGSERAGAARRATIVESALSLFATQGYRGTSVAAVAEAAGVSQSGLLHHFPSKEALLAAVLAERDRQVFDEVQITRDYEGPATVRALEIVYDMVAQSAENRELTRLGHLATAGSNEIPELALGWARQRIRTFQENLAQVIVHDIAAGHVRPEVDPVAVASLVIGTITGVEEQWLLDESYDMLTAMRLFTRMLRDDLMT